MTGTDSTSNPVPGEAQDGGNPDRRAVLKKAGAVGIAAAWAVPAVQTLGMPGAAAQGSPAPPRETGTITGQVTNATNANPIQGATVTVDSGQSATTDAGGNYTITGVPAGNHNVTASATGFISSTQNTTVPPSGTVVLNFGLAPASSGAIRAVLSWGSSPSDLDLHVSGPVYGGSSSRFHVYYAHAAERDGTNDPYCELDVDDVTGNGPETQTITISNSEGNYVAGVYRVWVHNFSRSTFDGSGATINLFDLSTQRGSFAQSAVGDPSDDQDIWKVVEFTIADDGTMSLVTPAQTMEDGDQTFVW
ncbi:MAG: carboxypeptidase regulatory-like domain-containing protein [Actinomycetes bacterium]